MPVSKFEENCRMIFEIIFDAKFISCRPKFLMNPVTKRCLELDGFCPKLKIAFEAQGEQHYKHSAMSFFSKNHDEEFLKRILYDDFKRKVCEKVGVKLYEVFYETNLSVLAIKICQSIAGCGTQKYNILIKKTLLELKRRHQITDKEINFILR